MEHHYDRELQASKASRSFQLALLRKRPSVWLLYESRTGKKVGVLLIDPSAQQLFKERKNIVLLHLSAIIYLLKQPL